MNNKKYIYGFIVLAIVTTLAMAVPAFADLNTPSSNTTVGAGWGGHIGGRGMMGGNKGMMMPVVFGTVSAVSGNTITVAGKTGFGANASTTTFTVDATNAKIMKNNVAGTISSIVVGDTVVVQGTITGTNVVATMIRDGQVGMGKGVRGGLGNPMQNPTSPIIGNGQPVVAGTVSIVSGSTLTITNKSNVTYTVDATNAKIVQGQNTITVSNIAVGDGVIVQGMVNGNVIVASSVIDQKQMNTTTTVATPAPVHKGFFGTIGSFFSHIFGF